MRRILALSIWTLSPVLALLMSGCSSNSKFSSSATAPATDLLPTQQMSWLVGDWKSAEVDNAYTHVEVSRNPKLLVYERYNAQVSTDDSTLCSYRLDSDDFRVGPADHDGGQNDYAFVAHHVNATLLDDSQSNDACQKFIQQEQVNALTNDFVEFRFHEDSSGNLVQNGSTLNRVSDDH